MNVEKRIGIVGVAVQTGQPRCGAITAPDTFRNAGLIEQLQGLGHVVADYGNFFDVVLHEDEPWYKAKLPRTVSATEKVVAETVAKAVQENSLVFNLGGDHSMAVGTFQGHLKTYPNPDDNVCLLWVDAHGDINLPFNSLSGNVHGMPVGLHMKELADTYQMPDHFRCWFNKRISTKNLAYIGLRDLDDDERRIIEHFNIKAFTMHKVEKLGIAHCLKECLQAINPNMDKQIHLSFDIDAMDPTVCPSTGTPVPGGLSIREGMYICQELQKTGLLRVVDLAEVNPALGSEADAAKTVEVAMLLLKACAGDIRDLSITPQHWLKDIPA